MSNPERLEEEVKQLADWICSELLGNDQPAIRYYRPFVEGRLSLLQRKTVEACADVCDRAAERCSQVAHHKRDAELVRSLLPQYQEVRQHERAPSG